jgi:hypothetical protein
LWASRNELFTPRLALQSLQRARGLLQYVLPLALGKTGASCRDAGLPTSYSACPVFSRPVLKALSGGEGMGTEHVLHESLPMDGGSTGCHRVLNLSQILLSILLTSLLHPSLNTMLEECLTHDKLGAVSRVARQERACSAHIASACEGL